LTRATIPSNRQNPPLRVFIYSAILPLSFAGMLEKR